METEPKSFCSVLYQSNVSYVSYQELRIFISRRFVWNFFRLENEHLNNCGDFRAVRDISVMPMDPNDHILLETLMDDETGPPRASSGNIKTGKANKNKLSRSTIIGNASTTDTTVV